MATVEEAIASSEKWSPADVPKIENEELIAKIEQNEVVVVDARTRAERNVARLASSLSIREFEKVASRGEFRDKDIVVMCTIGRRSGLLARKLRAQEDRKWKNVLNARGIVVYSHHPHAQKEGPAALVDANGKLATHLHVFASPWDLGSPHFQSVRFGPLSIMIAGTFPSLL